MEKEDKKINVVGDLHIPGESETNNRVHSDDGLCPTIRTSHLPKVEDKSEDIPDLQEGEVAAMLTPGRMEKRQNGTRYKTDGTSHTLTCQDHHGVLDTENGRIRIRYLTPRECWRLQGFPDEAFDAAVKAGMTKTALYSQAGNSIAVPCLYYIFDNLYNKKAFKQKKKQWFRYNTIYITLNTWGITMDGMFTGTVHRVGGSLMITIPKNTVRLMDIKEGDVLDITIETKKG